MDLEKINQEYSKFKADLENVSKEIEALQNKKDVLIQDRRIYDGLLAQAERQGDSQAKQVATNEIKAIDEKLEKIKEDTIEKKEGLTNIQTKIDDKIKEVKENPEMKKHLEEVLSKKYERKISKLEKNKEELEDKKDRFTSINQLVTEHPALGNNLKGIISSTKQLEYLEKELEGLQYDMGGGLIGYTDPNKANEIQNVLIPQVKDKLKTNKEPLMSYIAKKGLNITEQDIGEIANNGIIDEKGNVDLTTTMTKNVAMLNRQIKGLDKSLQHHKMSLDSIDKTSPRIEDTDREGYEEEIERDEARKPKWYQFIKRFRNWNEKRKQEALPEPEEEREEEPGEREKKKNKFKDSMKYDIIKDIVKEEEKDNLRKSKEELKNRDDDSER